jgi:hypothetical protein
MGTRAPDYRWVDLIRSIKNKKRPSDAILQPVYDVIRGKMTDDVIDEALSLINKDFSRDVMVAFFLSGAMFKEIEDSIKVKRPVAELVKHLIMDMQVFRNKLELIEYIDYYCNYLACSRGKRYIEIGVEGGPYDLAHFFHVGRETVVNFVPADIMQRMILNMAHNSYTLRSDASPGAQKMMIDQTNATTKMVMAYDRVKHDDLSGSFDALAAIVNRRTATSIDDLPVTREELVH